MGAFTGTPAYTSRTAIVPTALGVNPSETIAALAERNVEQLVRAGGPQPS